MLIIPAIDIKAGKCVRLRQGRFDKATEYSDDPVSMAKKWVSLGAQRLHIVDLDGAFSGHPVNRKIVEGIREAISIPLQIGGGIRSSESVDDYLHMGINQVVLGTSIVKQEGFLDLVCQKNPGKIIAALDTRSGKVATQGWVETTEENTEKVLGQITKSGVKAIIFTDIQTDGMLSGPNIKAIKEILKKVGVPLIASGGVSSMGDLDLLMDVRKEGLLGVIIGKALYDGLLDLPLIIQHVGEKQDVSKADYSLS